MATTSKIGQGFDKSGSYSRRILKYTGPTSYTTGGDTLTPEEVSLGRIEAVLGLTVSNATNTYFGHYNRSTKKILWYSATNTEVSNATDLSGYTGQIEVIGI